MNRKLYESMRESCTQRLRVQLGMETTDTVSTGIVLGTGWADAFPFQAEHATRMQALSGPFEAVEELDGHARRYETGMIDGKRIVVLRGRVHMNEFVFNPMGKLAVRAQIEVLLGLGVKNLVLTTGVGALTTDIDIGSVVLIDGWVSSNGEEMPLFAGEFANPEDTIAKSEFDKIVKARPEGLCVVVGGHVFWHGPHFEGRKYDKRNMRSAGASCVSMSVKPEACIAALHPGVRVLPMGFVCNGPQEPMEHEHHRDVAKQSATPLGRLLTNVVHLLEP